MIHQLKEDASSEELLGGLWLDVGCDEVVVLQLLLGQVGVNDVLHVEVVDAQQESIFHEIMQL